MGAVGYIRVSSQEQAQNETSLERQRSYIQKYCELHGLELVDILCDKGKSGFKSSRRGFNELRNVCLSRKVTTVIVYDLSRLSRSVRCTLEFVEEVIIKNDISFISLQQKIDTSTPSGKAFLAISAVFNQLYRDEISFKARNAIKHKQDRKQYIGGNVPYGYSLAEDGTHLVENYLELEIIAKVRAFARRGDSLRSIAERLNSQGLKPRVAQKWVHSSVNKIIKRAW